MHRSAERGREVPTDPNNARHLQYLGPEDDITKQWFFNMRNDPDLLKFTEAANELAVRPWFNRVWVK
jgi:hypothetical protein